MRFNEVAKEKFTPMMQQYIDCKSKLLDAIVFYRIGDFYEMFFDDAYIASRELELQLTGKDAGYSERVPMCGIPYHASSEYISKLVGKGLKVAIVEQVEDPQTAKGIVKRDVVKIVTPGTMVDQGLTDKENNYIVAISPLDKQYALCYADISTGESFLTEVKNMELLANEILSLKCHEVIVSKNFQDEYLLKLKDNYNVCISVENDDVIPDEYKYILYAIEKKYNHVCGILINYLLKTQCASITHMQAMKYYTNDSYLRIDPYTKRNLELTETLRQGQKNGSLIWLLDKCETAMGSRMMHKWIDRPLVDKKEIMLRQDFVESLMNNYIIKEDLKDSLKGVYDLERIIGRITCGNANARDLVQLKRSLSKMPQIKNLVSSLPLVYAKEVSNKINLHESLYKLLDDSLFEDVPLTIKEGGIIKDGYNSELDELRNIQNNSKDWILNFEAKEKERTGIKTMHVGYNRVFGYYIEVSKGQLSQISEEDHYERKQTLANAERFITPELKHYEQIITGSSDKIVKLEYDLFVKIREEALKATHSLQELANIISTIDCLLSFANIASEHNYVKPTFNDNREVTIIEGRHPVLETIISDEYVKNDVIINSYNTILITGPNMSGKSTYMRELALIAIMAQIGSFVPADSANLMIFDQIFTRIGASDDLLSGQSTFMVEMLEANYAISNATKNSLILFDELGRGTSTFDGMALAQSIIEYVHEKIGCAMLFSTHYHELCELEHKLKHLKNVHVSAKEYKGGIVFLHKVIDGGADKSYGINVAQLAGLPKSLIERSKQVLASLEEKDIKVGAKLDLFNFSEYEKSLEEEPKEEENEVIKDLRNLDVDSLSARDALNYLYELKKKIEE
jgi:DNA mismatch repair protein MutS